MAIFMIMRERDPVWAWDGDWRPARVVVPALGRNRRLICFDSGVTAPIGKAKIRPRDPRWRGADKPPANVLAAAGRLVLRGMDAAARIRPAWTFGLSATSSGARLSQVPRLNSGLEEKMSLAPAFRNFAPKGSRRPSPAAF
jgi:hypothetical protein